VAFLFRKVDVLKANAFAAVIIRANGFIESE
jgi:hypothetical protein